MHHCTIQYKSTTLLLLLLSYCCSSLAVNFPDKPPESDFFVDKASLISTEDRAEINEIASNLLSEEDIPIFIVTIGSLATYEASSQTIETYATALFNEWGIGSPERNYGILLLVSRGDRRARIELGADWGYSHDRAAQDIMDNLIIKQFKRDEYSLGILDGVRGLDAMARGLALPKATAPWWFLPALAIGAILFVMLIINLFKTGRSGWAWALIAALGALLIFILYSAASSSGGSGGGFGGGSSGGGGASGSW
ncbi:MAG: hypothetical protein DHS20C09_11440 [marine bacterium B5-7]|nr:MAG: hypothetical protein DHS20C09_11440 [marine bacterium B5-7]